MKATLEFLKKYLTLMAFGALVGVALCYWAPTLIGWWAAPVVEGRVYSCEAEVAWGMKKLMQFQAGAALGFGMLFAIGGGLISSAMRKRAARKLGETGLATTEASEPHDTTEP